MKQAWRDAMEKTLTAEFASFGRLLGSPEAMEAFNAFFERRKPDFSKFG
jgi:1,4-dihydroxy-2-naphthoyl-CoA synthase